MRNCENCPYYKWVEGEEFRACSKWKCVEEEEQDD